MSGNWKRKMGVFQFGAVLAEEKAWFLQGYQLLTAAEVLLEQLWVCRTQRDVILQSKTDFKPNDPDSKIVERSLLEPQISMLVGFAVENFLKGAWIKLNPMDSKDAISLPPVFTSNTGHNLIDLAKAINLPLSDADKSVLQILTIHSTWRGRYMIPRNQQTNINFWTSNVEVCFISKKYPNEVEWPDELNTFLDKLHNFIYSEEE